MPPAGGWLVSAPGTPAAPAPPGLVSSEVCSLRTTALSGLYCFVRLFVGVRLQIDGHLRAHPAVADQRREQLLDALNVGVFDAMRGVELFGCIADSADTSATTAGGPADRPP